MNTLVEVAEFFRREKRHQSIEHAGAGTFKQAFRLRQRNGINVAFKLYHPDNFDIERTKEEINALIKCKSKHIGKLYEYGYYKYKDGKSYFYTCEEYFDGGTLREKLDSNKLENDFIINLAYILVLALGDLREDHIVHRDIKPDNIMFRKGNNDPFLVDFGLVRNLDRESLTPTWAFSGPGTPFYSAPEQLNNQKELIDWRTDQFSLGIVIAECLIGSHPFQKKGKNINNAITAVAGRQNYPADFVEQLKKINFDWVLKMISPWPHQRYALPSELITLLEDRR